MSSRARRALCAIAISSLPVAAPLAAQGPGGGAPRPITNPVLQRIWSIGMDSSQTYPLAQALLDSIGPRLNGSPGHKAGNDWLVAQYAKMGITARNEQYGTWRSWKRGPAHLDLLQPRVRTLEATMLAWSPGTNGKPVQGSVVILPDFVDSLAFAAWVPSVKGKMVLVSAPQASCRPIDNWEKWGEPASVEKIKAQRDSVTKAWDAKFKNAAARGAALWKKIEAGSPAAILSSNWSPGWGVDKIFSTTTEKAPVMDVACEDYGLLYRLAERNQSAVVRLTAESQFLGEQPVFNTIAEIKGSEKPNEYVMLSAHFDSWDSSSGATDNGTGTIMMMEALRILKQVYPTPKRTILVGHWGGEEQGLNGSHAFVEDHPEVVQGLEALFNEDNGTGRIENTSPSGFIGAVPVFTKWIAQLPGQLTRGLNVGLPGAPAGGGSDHASFACAGAPGFSLGATQWNYFDYTWHTNRDTFDKLVFDDLRRNATMAAMLAYLASEESEVTGREKTAGIRWPECQKSARTSVGSAR